MFDRTAILGHPPRFEQKVSIVRPVLPPYQDISQRVQSLVESGMLTKGQHLEIFEQRLAEYLGVKHVIGVSSCTTGLMLTYKCLGLTGEAIVPSFSFMATVSALVWAGVKPVFADVNPRTATLDIEAVEAAITPATTAIVAVHTFGNPADIQGLQKLAARHHLLLIFDAAHGFGSLSDGVPVGPQGDAQIFSMTPTKLLIAGEGGIVATDNDQLAENIRMGREYGNSGDYDSAFAGFNARLSEFNALLGQASLDLLENAAYNRNEYAKLYQDRLCKLPGIKFQKVRAEDRSSYKDFSITIDPEAFGLSRDQLATALAAENIDTRRYYDPPIHKQTAYRRFAPSADLLKNTDFLAAQSLSLPMWSRMEKSVLSEICSVIEGIHKNANEVRMKSQSFTTSA